MIFRFYDDKLDMRTTLEKLILLVFFIFSISAFAMNGRTTYQAKIVKPDGYPLEAANVSFRFSVLDSVGSCVLYVEDYVGVNMSGGRGLVSFALGNGARSFPVSGTSQTFAQIFDNAVPMFNCQVPGTYNPGPNDTRKIVMQFNDGSGWQTLPAMNINAVPYAMYAAKSNDTQTLNGKSDAAFVENATLAALNCNSSTHAITFNGVNFSCLAVGSGGSGVTSVVTSGSVLVTGGTASAPVISILAATISQDGYLTSVDYAEFKSKLSASSTQIVSTLGYAPVSSAAVASQIDSSATTSATVNSLVKRDSSGNSSFSGVSANTASLNYVDLYKPSTSFNIRLQAPTSISANYVLSLPATSGTTGQVLSTDGLGNLSWINAATGSVTSVSGTANEITSTGGATPVLGLANTGTAGTYFKVTTDSKGRVTSGAQLVSLDVTSALGYIPVASGSVVSSQWITSGTDIFRSSGNVGIGAATPITTLDVNGTGRFTNSLNIQAGFGSGAIKLGADVNASTLTANVRKVGRIVVPSYDNNSNVLIISGDNDSTDNNVYFGGFPGSTTIAAATKLHFMTAPSLGVSGGTERMTVDSNGNVGIGTTSPSARLQLASGTSTLASFKLTSGTLLSSAQAGAIEYDGFNFYLTDSTNTRKVIEGNTSVGNYSNVSQISSSGNISLVPAESVIVSSTVPSINPNTGALIVKGGLGVTGAINTAANLNVSGSLVMDGSLRISSFNTGSVLFTTSGGTLTQDNSNFFWDDTSQRLGIGTNTPSADLQITKQDKSTVLAIENTSSSASKYPGLSILNYMGATLGHPFLTMSNYGGSSAAVTATPSGRVVMALIGAGHTGSGAVQASRIQFVTEGMYSASGNPTSIRFLPGASSTTGYFEAMRITPNGDVGIGTSAPGSKLDIRSSNSSYFQAINVQNESASGGALTIMPFAGALANAVAGDTLITNGVGNILISPNAAGKNIQLIGGAWTNSPSLTVASTGNVGIGTSNPVARLDMLGSSTGEYGQYIQNTDSSGYAVLRMNNNFSSNASGTALHSFGSGYGTSGTAYAPLTTTLSGFESGGLVLHANSGGIGFFTAGNAINNKRMTIDANGNVGIGRNMPWANLLVGIPFAKTDTTLREGFAVASNDVVNPFKFYVGLTGGSAVASRSATLQTSDHGLTNGGSILFQPNGGNVGIGTMLPEYKLTVPSGISVGDSIAGNSNISLTPLINSYLGSSGDAGSGSTVWILLAYNQSAASGISASGFDGQIYTYRGSAGSWNNASSFDVAVKTAYNGPGVYRFNTSGPQSAAQIVTLTYAGTSYVALQIPQGSSQDIYLTGRFWAFKPILLDSVNHAGVVTAVTAISNPFINTAVAANGFTANVGINNPSPQATLDVSGTIKHGYTRTLTNSSGVTFSGLNGNVDGTYEITITGRIFSGGANKSIRLGPNGSFVTAGFKNLAHRFYDSNGTVTTDTNARNTGGFTAGFSDWNADGEIIATTRLMAKAGRVRLLNGSHTFVPNVATLPNYIMQATLAASWTDTTTNITSLAIDFEGGTFTGEIVIRTIQP